MYLRSIDICQRPLDEVFGRVFILGAGPAGAAAALSLRDAGCEVHLAERSECPGGRATRFSCKATDHCLRCNVCLAQNLLRRAFRQTDGITVHTHTELRALRPGSNGRRFTVELDSPDNAPDALDADAVLLATGFEPYDAATDRAWNYGRLPNVLTAADLEAAMLGDRKPILRPSDGKAPDRLAFIQCVGSRTEQTHRGPQQTDYCSTVCCAYALRQARLLKHLRDETDLTVFYMDLQRFGRDFETFLAETRQAVRFLKARPYRLEAAPEDRVTVFYEDQQTTADQTETFDLVVLSIGMRCNPDAAELAARLGIATDPQGFFQPRLANLAGLSDRDGVYLAGACRGPMDLAQAIAQARAAAGAIAADLREVPA